MVLPPGTRLGGYEVLSLLGLGGMGEVYRAKDHRLSRQVALKVLPTAVAADPERLARFHREAQVLAALNHPNIAGIYGLEEGSGVSALVMELVDGDDLSERIAREPMPVDEALPIARQIAEALETAHEQGIVHRDLKPANIKVRTDGSVKVLDFGLAKAMEQGLGSAGQDRGAGAASMSPTLTSPAMTQAGVILGTAAYMSPEQARGRPVDRRADIWAFGAVLFEMLTGRRAFPGEDITDTIVSVVSREPGWDALPAATPSGLRRLLVRCLRKDQKTRMRDIGEARVQLDELISGAAEEMPGAVFAQSATARTALWRRAIPVAAAVAVASALGAYAAWTLRPRPQQHAARFVIPLPEGQSFTNPGRQLVTVSPDGTQVVYVANQRLYLRRLSSLEAWAIPGSEVQAGVLNPVFSPDGLWVAFFSAADNTLKRLPVAGGAPTSICATDAVFGMAWDESGIVFSQGARGIFRVSPDGGVPQVIASVAEDEIASAPQLLPGVGTLLFSVKKTDAAWDKGQIVVQRIGATDRKVLIEGGADGRYVPSGHLVYALSGVLYARPFDVRTLSVSGGPVPIIEGVRRALGTRLDPADRSRGTGVAHVAYSKNGVMAYVPGSARATGDASGLALFDRRGGSQPVALPEGEYSSPRVSPDGTLAALERVDGTDSSIWIADITGREAARRLTFEGNNRAPVWSPDGRWVAFQSNREGDDAVFRQHADGTGAAERLTTPETGAIHTPQSWSPDGANLLVSVEDGLHATPNEPLRSSLSVLSLKERRLAPFGDVRAREAAFSPDGRWVAYQTPVADAAFAVFLEPFPRTGSKYQVPQDAPGGHPFWSPSGGEIIMNTGPSQSTVVSVRTTPQVSFGQPVRFQRAGRWEPNPAWGRRSVDVMPDGQHVLGVARTADDSAGAQINVVVGWFDELKAMAAPTVK